MRISDWSSDVCSSDLRAGRADGRDADRPGRRVAARGVEASRHPAAGGAGARPPAGAAGALQRPARRAGAARRLDGADDAFLAGALRRSRQSAGKDGSMTETDTRTVVVEREFAHPPAKVWRALTQRSEEHTS